MSTAGFRRSFVLGADNHFTSLALEQRARLERRYRRGPDVDAAVVLAVSAARPHMVVEVGGGAGVLAAKLGAHLAARVVAVDGNAALVADARARGLTALVAEVQRLPLRRDAVGCVVADRALWRRRDVTGGLPEIRRVLRDDGVLVAVARSQMRDGHEFDALLDTPVRSRADVFTVETAHQLLAPHFDAVEQQTLDYVLDFPSGAAAAAYVATLPGGQRRQVQRLASLERPIRATYGLGLFVAARPHGT